MLCASSWFVQIRISIDCWDSGTATHRLVFTVQQGPCATVKTQAAASPPAHWGCWREDPSHGTLWFPAQRALWLSIKESRGIPDPGEVWYPLVEGKRPLGVRWVARSLSNTSSFIPYRLLKHKEGCSLAQFLRVYNFLLCEIKPVPTAPHASSTMISAASQKWIHLASHSNAATYYRVLWASHLPSLSFHFFFF